MENSRLSEYELRAQKETHAWRHKPPGAVARRVGAVLEPVDKLMERYVFRGPVTKALEGAMWVAMDAASWTIDNEKVLAGYREAGFAVHKLDDIPRLVPMEYIDRQVSALPKYYYGSMGAEGAVAGAASFFGPLAAAAALAADMSLVTGVSCRAVSHFGASYGYDATLLHERHYALTVMGVAGALTEAGKAAAVAEVTRVGGMVAKKKTWEQLSQSQLVNTLQQVAKKFGQDLTKKKLGQLVFALGVIVGGSVNTWYLNRVTNAAYYAYRERFLEDRARHMNSPADESEPPVADAEVVGEKDGSGAVSPSVARILPA